MAAVRIRSMYRRRISGLMNALLDRFWDGWDGPTRSRPGGVPGRAHFEPLEPKVLLSADLLPGTPLNFTDADGTLVTVTLSGSGTGVLDDTGGAASLALQGNDLTTRVVIAAQGGDGRFVLAGLSASGRDLGAIVAPAADLTGVIRLDGHLGELSLRAAPGASEVHAASVGTLSVATDFSAGFELTGPDAGLALTRATIGGVLSGTWNLQGRSGSLKAGEVDAAWTGAFGDPLTSLTTVGDFRGTAYLPSLLQLTVGGALSGATLVVGADLGSDGALGGAGTRADTFSTGNLSRVRVNGAVLDSTIRVGVDPVNGVFDDGNDTVLPGGRIQEFLVGGALTNSTVIAATLPPQVRVQGSLVSTATLPAFRSAAPDKVAPGLVASLASDTGASSTDRITRDPTVSGRVTDLGAVTGLTLSFLGREVDVSQALNADGTFQLTRGVIEAALGTTLPDGAVAFGLRARDAGGNFSNLVTVAFELDTTAPDLLSFGVVSADAVGGDNAKAAAASVVLRGEGTAGATVSYAGQDVLVGAGGVFTLPGVGLTLGDNAITLTIRDLAGNTDTLTRTITRVAQTQADPVLVWNDIALRAVQLDVTDPPVATRALALVSLAQYDALAAIEGMAAYLVQRTVSGPVSAAAATAAAAHRVLSRIYPAQQAVFDDALSRDLAAIDNGAAKDSGIALGLAIADAILALRANDGSEDFASHDGSTALGKWRPTGPAFDVADVPQWATVEPFALSSPSQFRPAAPPALDTAAYAAAVEEVKRLGSATSAQRTADQTQIALFWADGKGSFTPPGHWNQIAAEIARSQGRSLTDNARLFAQLNVALADTAIACWDAKYTYGLWRPETAIQNADLDSNAGTTVDAAWRPLLLTPPHPEYVSGHSSFSRAAATVLASHFGDDTAFSTTSATLPGVTRTYASFTEAAEEAGRSRIYGGIHYEFTNQAGQVLGAQVADAVLARFALSGDSQAPAIPLDDTPAVTNTNVTLRGQVLDNLSGVAAAQFRIDGGALQALSLDANGGFTITTTLPTDGSADGAHTITIVARDVAGNANPGVTRGFTLDTKAPTITLPSLPDGAALGASSRLTGTANPTGTTLTQLSYRIDGGVSRSLAFDAVTGAFDESLSFGNLDVGDHTLVLTARDAGGNLATLTRTVKVEALAPLTVTGLTPTEGSGDVGVTVRPQVRFSRAVNLATLTTESFYATGPDGSKLAATVVPANDGTYAWLFFTEPMPGGSQVTLHVDGSKIRGAADGTFLDADGNGAAGGTLTQSFTTVSRTVVAGTKLVGKVVDPGPDLEPMTFDDIRRGPDGVIHTPDDVFLLPIAHAKVFILGQEDKFVFTDAAGNFELTDVPAGTVKVAIDGRTATNAPAGVFFPEMVMDVELRPGVVNTVMSGMGSDAERAANLDRREVYLPRIPTSSLQAVSDTATTVITVSDAKSAPQLSEQERAALTLTVQPGSAIGEDGQALENVQIGISTVPPELVRDMLPPGVLQHTFDITIQAPGVATFAEPLQITFPNVFNAAPGTKLNILSFDHTTGRLVINGTGTVSADGLTVVSDPDSGIRAPGWHGLIPPGFVPPLLIQVPDLWSDLDDCIKTFLPQMQDDLQTLMDNPSFKNDVMAPIQTAIFGASQTGLWGAVGGLAFGQIIGSPIVSFDPKTGVGQIQGGILDSPLFENLWDELKADWEAAGIQAIGQPITSRIGYFLDSPITLFSDHPERIPFFGLGIGLVNAWDDIKKLIDDGIGILDCVDPDAPPSPAPLAAATAAVPSSLSDPTTEAKLLFQFMEWGDPAPDDIALHETMVTTGGRLPDALRRLGAAQSLFDYADRMSDTYRLLALGVSGVDVTAEVTANLDYLSTNARPFFEGMLALEKVVSGFFDSVQKEITAEIAGRRVPDRDLANQRFFYAFSSGDQITRGVASSMADIEAVVPPSQLVEVTLHNASRGLTGRTVFLADRSGAAGVPVTLTLMPDNLLPDGDADGLSDIAERAIGTSLIVQDTDRDGVLDSVEVKAGTSPLDGIPVVAGVISTLAIAPVTEAIVVGSLASDLSKLLAFVASGSGGLSVADVTNVFKPGVVGTLALPGACVDVALDNARALAVVAAGVGGVHIVDVSDPGRPTLRVSIALPEAAGAVVVRDGIAYVTHGTTLSAIDLNTGEIRKTLGLGGGTGTTITDIVVDGNTLYTMDSNRVLQSIEISGELLSLRDSLALANGGGELFVAGGIAYVGTTTEFSQGFSTVSVTDPAHLVLLSGIDAANVAGQSISATGAGKLVNAGFLRGQQGQSIFALDVLDATDPSDTGAFLSRVTLTAAPKALALANGLAFVVDQSGRLQIVNFTAADTKGVAPTVSFVTSTIDADPDTPGVQVLEGRPVHVIPTIRDDVQVRNVELLVNGTVVSNDLAFPWDVFAQVPTLLAGGNTMTIQVRATDTGGNIGLSNVVTLDVVADTFPPQVVSVSVAEGERRFFVRSIDVVFDEPVDVARLGVEGIHLMRAGADGTFGTADDLAAAVSFDTRDFGQSLSILVEDVLVPGDYRLTIDADIVADRAGNTLAAPIVRNFNVRPASDVTAASGTPAIPTAPAANPGQEIAIAVPFDPATARAQFFVTDATGNRTTRVLTPSRTDPLSSKAYFTVPLDAITGDVTVFSLVGSVRTDFPDGTFPLQVLPVIQDVQVQSVSGDGATATATVLISGLGFVEAGNSEYRFGSTVLVDAGATTGPDVQARFDPVLGFVPNGAVSVTVPLIGGSFGGISVKTAGGTSAQYSVSVDAIESVALSGTPADGGQASANAGQAVELRGSGLSTGTDVLLRWVDINGTQQVARVSPLAASADGTSATLEVPRYANGAFALQVFGSESQPLLQVVPRLTGFGTDGRTNLLGTGFVEGATVYGFPGRAVSDTAGDPGDVDVGFASDFSAQNGSVSLSAAALPSYGFGSVTVSTAGGTSAALALEALRTSVTGVSLGDVAVDVQGQLWVSDQASPGHLLKVDVNTGLTLQTITMSAAYGTQFTQSYVGLQVLRGTMRLGSTDVGPGNLLVFNGVANTDRVVAVNPSNGAVLATLALGENYDLTGAAYDETGNRIYVSSERGNAIVVVNAQTGAEVQRIAAPFGVSGNSGLAIDTVGRRLWVGSVNGGAQLVEYAIGSGGGLTETRRIDTRPQGVDGNEITGLSYRADGKLYVATNQAMVYRITIAAPPAPPAPVLSPEILASLSTQSFAAVPLTATVPAAGGDTSSSTAAVSSAARVVDEIPMIRLPVASPSAERVEARKPSVGALADVSSEGGIVQWKKPLREALKAFRMAAMARK